MMQEFEEDIFEALEEEYINSDRSETDIVFAVMDERVRIAHKLLELAYIDVDQISNITGLAVKDVMQLCGNNRLENTI